MNYSNGVKRFREQGRVEAMLNDSVNQVLFMSVLVNDICDLFERSQLKGGVPLGLSGSGSVIQDHSDYSKQG